MYIDTHLHLLNEDYESVIEVIERAKKNNVDKLIVSGCDDKSIKEALELSKKHDNIYVTLGYHPSEVLKVGEVELKRLQEIVIENSKVVGIGEIGLDYHYSKDDKIKQMELFQKQLKMAEELSLPVVIHSREATKDTIDILKKYSVRGIIHCFSGSKEVADIYIKMGYKLGIGGVLTFSNSNLADVIKTISLENIVLETDSPYLAPVPFRGSKNEPMYIPYIAKKLAEIKQVPVENVAYMTTKNATIVFDLK